MGGLRPCLASQHCCLGSRRCCCWRPRLGGPPAAPAQLPPAAAAAARPPSQDPGRRRDPPECLQHRGDRWHRPNDHLLSVCPSMVILRSTGRFGQLGLSECRPRTDQRIGSDKPDLHPTACIDAYLATLQHEQGCSWTKRCSMLAPRQLTMCKSQGEMRRVEGMAPAKSKEPNDMARSTDDPDCSSLISHASMSLLSLSTAAPCVDCAAAAHKERHRSTRRGVTLFITDGK
jgi:hypothetical protein